METVDADAGAAQAIGPLQENQEAKAEEVKEEAKVEEVKEEVKQEEEATTFGFPNALLIANDIEPSMLAELPEEMRTEVLAPL